MNWRQQWQELRQQLRANLRLRIGLILVGALPLVYFALVLRDLAVDSAQQYRIAANRLASMKTQAEQNEWAEHQKAATILKTELEGRLWKSPTPTLARAAFQDWLNAQTAQSGIGNLLLVMEDSAAAPDSENAPDTARVAAKLNFTLSASTLNVFLQRLVDAQPHVAIETLSITKEPAPRVEMIVAIQVAQQKEP